ncbi:hypothetical protein HY949_02100 [Candidatus Gottesmanbacteria bacterium]|nr:hypothetical protein [Candidatus Gottesmanbacteria bacterium]
MQTLKEKIKNTTLLSDEDKIAILVAVDGYGEADTKALEKIIDEFDSSFARSVADYKKAVFGVLDTIAANQKPDDAPRIRGAAGQIKTGIDGLLQV